MTFEYRAVPSMDSKHYRFRVHKTKGPEIGGDVLRLAVNPHASKRQIVEHLDRIRDWILAGEEVSDIRPDTFFLEYEAITQLRAYQKGRSGRVKRYRARFVKGTPELI